MRRLMSIVLAASAPTILVLAFVLGSTPDEEEFPWGILSSFLHVRALAGGTFGTWNSMLGFGMPQPMAPNFDMHPLVPLLLIVSPVTWVRVLLAAHTVLGAIGMWHVGRMLQLTPVVRAVSVFTFMLATPTQNYTMTDFWPSHYVMWTSSPWLLLLGWRTLQASGPELRRLAVMLGVATGLTLASTHPGHAPVYGVVAAAFVAAEWRAVRARWVWLLLASCVAAAIAAPSLIPLLLERPIFDPGLVVIKLPEPLPPSAAWDLFARPLTLSDDPWQRELVNRGTRIVFFGGPFAVLTIVGVIGQWRRHTALVLTVLIASVLVFTPLLPLTYVSRFHIRDPLTLCAIPLAGVAADALLSRRWGRWPALVMLGAQVLIVMTAVTPFLDRMLDRDGREARQFHGAVADTPAADTLLTATRGLGRLSYSAQIDLEVSQLEHLEDGLGRNALVYRGIPVVNGTFKGISNDVLWPSERLFYGRIRVPRQLIASETALDLLGIRYVLANPTEAVAPGLVARASVPKGDGQPAVLYENIHATAGVFVLATESPHQLPPLIAYPDCPNDGLLCKDVAPLAPLRRDERVAITRAGETMEIEIEPSNAARTVVVAEMFRPGWGATQSNGDPLETFSLGPGLLAVIVPAAVGAIHLTYAAPLFVWATIVAWLTVLVALGVLIFHNKI
jgi:hypothetical protein